MKCDVPIVAIAACCGMLGCQSGPLRSLVATEQRTSYRTPAARSAEALAIGRKAEAATPDEQQAMVAGLARQIQNERDPLVRESLIKASAAFPQPLAGEILTAGLSDSDPGVRRACCVALGRRRQPETIAALAQASRSDDDFDVRVAATLALGEFTSDRAVQALVAALEDSEPAIQYAGVQAMRSATGQDLGNRVDAYLALARGEAPPAVATRTSQRGGFWRRLSPF